MEEWKTYKLKDICELIAGFAFKSSEFGNHPIKAIKIGDIKPPYVADSEMIGVDVSAYSAERLSKYAVHYGDFVLAMTGATIGKIGRYISHSVAYINQRVLLFKPYKEFDNDFIYYSIISPYFQKYVLNHVDSETAQPNISANSIGGFELRVPNIQLQRKISSVLKSLDDKIELNRRINDNLRLAS